MPLRQWSLKTTERKTKPTLFFRGTIQEAEKTGVDWLVPLVLEHRKEKPRVDVQTMERGAQEYAENLKESLVKRLRQMEKDREGESLIHYMDTFHSHGDFRRMRIPLKVTRQKDGRFLIHQAPATHWILKHGHAETFETLQAIATEGFRANEGPNVMFAEGKRVDHKHGYGYPSEKEQTRGDRYGLEIASETFGQDGAEPTGTVTRASPEQILRINVVLHRKLTPGQMLERIAYYRRHLPGHTLAFYVTHQKGDEDTSARRIRPRQLELMKLQETTKEPPAPTPQVRAKKPSEGVWQAVVRWGRRITGRND